jgi:hypothetical protein
MTQTTQSTLVVEIDITHIERNPKQPRQWFDNEDRPLPHDEQCQTRQKDY